MSFAVVTATRDRPRLLRQCLTAMANQTLRPSEVVVVNDGGPAIDAVTDGLDLPIRVIRHPVSRGPPGALNQGVRATTADLVAFCDDDDVFAPDHLEVLARGLEASSVGLAYTDAHAFDQDLARPLGVLDRDFDHALLRETNFIAASSIGFRRALFDQLQGLDESLSIYWDWDFFLRTSGVTRLARVPGGVTAYRIHAGSMQTATPGQARADQLQRLCDKHGLGVLPVKHLFDLFRAPPSSGP